MLNALSKPSKGRVNHDKHWICDKIALFSWSAQTTSAILPRCMLYPRKHFVWSPARPRSHLADLIFPMPPFLTWLIGHPRRLHALSWPPYCHRQDFNSRQIRVICLRWRPFDQHAFINHLRPRGWPLKRQAAPYEAAWTGGGFIWAGKTLRNAYLGSTNAYSPWSDPCKSLPFWPTLYFGPPGGFWPEHIVFSMRGRYSKPRPRNVNIQCFAPECYYEMRMWSTITFLWRNQHPEAQKCPLGNNVRYGKLCWTQKTTTPNHTLLFGQELHKFLWFS